MSYSDMMLHISEPKDGNDFITLTSEGAEGEISQKYIIAFFFNLKEEGNKNMTPGNSNENSILEQESHNYSRIQDSYFRFCVSTTEAKFCSLWLCNEVRLTLGTLYEGSKRQFNNSCGCLWRCSTHVIGNSDNHCSDKDYVNNIISWIFVPLL